MLAVEFPRQGHVVLSGIDGSGFRTGYLASAKGTATYALQPVEEVDKAQALKKRVSDPQFDARLEVVFEPEGFGPTALIFTDVDGSQSRISALTGRALGYRIVDNEGELVPLTAFRPSPKNEEG